MQTVARTIVATLLAEGVTHAFGVPGESYLGLIDALSDVPDRLALITCRHEATAAHMAEAYGKLSGRLGVCLVTRGPGATQASIGVHTAMHDSTPMLLLVGQVERAMLGRGAFQEVDYEAFFAPLAKKVFTLRDPERTPEIIAAAVAAARSGRPGPVVVALPEDVLGEPAPAAVPTRFTSPEPAPSTTDLNALAGLLGGARRPVLLLGGTGWDEPALAAVKEAAERLRLPVVTSWRRKDLFDNRHPNYAGDCGLGANPAVVQRLRECDLLLVLGARMSEVPTHGYSVPAPPVAPQPLVLIHPDPDILGGVYRPTLAIQAHVRQAAHALAALADRLEPAADPDWVQQANASYRAWVQPTTVQSGVNMADVVTHLSTSLPPDSIVTNGAGNFSGWVHRFYEHRRPDTQLAPTSGAMGYGFPAAIAAKLLHPERTVVCVAGDGDFLMAAHEVATAVRYGVAVTVIVVDNGQYGTIAMHQARNFPGRPYGVALTNPDFAAMAESYGAFGVRVTETADFPAAFAAAQASGRPAVIACITDPKEIGPGFRLP